MTELEKKNVRTYKWDNEKIVACLNAGNLTELINMAYRLGKAAELLVGIEQQLAYKRGARYIDCYMKEILV